MINQNQLQSSEKMVDLFETEELESRLEMCGSGWTESSCPEPTPGACIMDQVQTPDGICLEPN